MTATGATVFHPSAEHYERFLVPAIFRSWAADLVDLAGPRPGDRVLDVACGTGIVARTAAPRVAPDGGVVGCDVNEAMLDVARREAAAAGATVVWSHGDAVALPFPGDAFDVVLCQQGVQFFADRTAGLAQMRRVTAPTGRIALSVWLDMAHHQVYRLFDEVLARHLGEEAVEGTDAPFSLPPSELRDRMAQAGLRRSQVRTASKLVRFPSPERMLAAVGGAHVPIADAVGSLDAGRHAELLDHLTAVLRPYTDGNGIAYPMTASLVVASP